MLSLVTFVAAILIAAVIALMLLYQKRFYLGIGILVLLAVSVFLLFQVTSETVALFLLLLLYLLPIIGIISLFTYIPIVESNKIRISSN